MANKHSPALKAFESPSFDNQSDFKILIVDDHPLFAEGLRLVIEVTRENTQFLHAKNLSHAANLLAEHLDIDLILLTSSSPAFVVSNARQNLSSVIRSSKIGFSTPNPIPQMM